MTLILSVILVVAVIYFVWYNRGERVHSKAERGRLLAVLEAVAREQAEEPFERYVLDIGSGPETFLTGEADGIDFRLSREIRKPKFRRRRYWMYLPGETLPQDFWTTFLPKGKFARLVDRILDMPAPPPDKEEPPAEAKPAETPPEGPSETAKPEAAAAPEPDAPAPPADGGAP